MNENLFKIKSQIKIQQFFSRAATVFHRLLIFNIWQIFFSPKNLRSRKFRCVHIYNIEIRGGKSFVKHISQALYQYLSFNVKKLTFLDIFLILHIFFNVKSTSTF